MKYCTQKQFLNHWLDGRSSDDSYDSDIEYIYALRLIVEASKIVMNDLINYYYGSPSMFPTVLYWNVHMNISIKSCRRWCGFVDEM